MVFLILILSAFVLTLLHTILPEHWMPFVLVGKAQNWSLKKTLSISAIAATGHVFMTLLIGLIVLFITKAVLDYVGLIEKFVTSSLLILIGSIYLIQGIRNKHEHSHKQIIPEKATIASLIALFSFSPCEAVIPLFLLATSMSVFAVTVLSITILLSTIIGMFVLISIALHGYRKVKFHWLEDNEHVVVGIILIVLGMVAYFI